MTNNGIFVFVEIKDHEILEPGSIEILGKARDLAMKYNEPLVAVMFAQNAEKYLSDLFCYKPDLVYYFDGDEFRHYDEFIFVPLLSQLIEETSPFAFLFPATEAGRDLAARIAQKIELGLTADCTDIEMIEKGDKKYIQFVKPGFGGNILAKIIAPKKDPQIGTIRAGTWNKPEPDLQWKPSKIVKRDTSNFEIKKLVEILCFPTRYSKKSVSLENADIIVAGGRGMGSKENFSKLFKLAELLNAQVAATRSAIFEGFIGEEYLIGQTGKTVRPKIYFAFAISGQIQHLTGIMGSGIIIAINKDKNAPIHKIADYSIIADVHQFLPILIKTIEENKISLERAKNINACGS